MTPLVITGQTWIVTCFCDIAAGQLHIHNANSLELTDRVVGVVAVAADTWKTSGMIRGWPMIDASSSFTPALMPVSPFKYSFHRRRIPVCRPGFQIGGVMPSRICRAISAVLLLLLPISTVPRLPGEPVPCGYKLTSERPSVPDSAFFVCLFHRH